MEIPLLPNPLALSSYSKPACTLPFVVHAPALDHIIIPLLRACLAIRVVDHAVVLPAHALTLEFLAHEQLPVRLLLQVVAPTLQAGHEYGAVVPLAAEQVELDLAVQQCGRV